MDYWKEVPGIDEVVNPGKEISDKNFVNAVLNALKGADDKTIKAVMTAMAKGKYPLAAKLLGGSKKGLTESTDNAKLVKDAIKAMKTAQSKIELLDRESSKMSPAGITGIISAMIKIRNSLDLALKGKIA